MDLSPQQEAAVKAVQAWLRDKSGPQVFRLFGFAGVGKTTLARLLAGDVSGPVLFAAYTGKAAYVLRSKGCEGATTIHSLIYRHAGEAKSAGVREVEQQLSSLRQIAQPTEADATEIERLARLHTVLLGKEGRKPMFKLNPDSDLRRAKLLVVDECSMVDQRIGEDLLSFGVKILVLGDPAQLPPVGSGGFFTNATPDVLLTEVHRHAQESGILRLATHVRTATDWRPDEGTYGTDCLVQHRALLGDDLRKLVTEADQVLVGRNATRHAYNARLREMQGKREPMPTAGDKVVCLRNNHELGILNGSLWRVHESVGNLASMDVEMTISSEEDGAAGMPVLSHAHHFMGREEELKALSWDRRDKEEFDYGYALTVHKAQGSQWEDVVLFDESGSFRADARRWLYTGITRAAKNLTVVL